MDNTITVNGKTYEFPCTVTSGEARAIRDAAPEGMLEAQTVASGWHSPHLFNLDLHHYNLRISPNWKPEEAPTTLDGLEVESAPKFPLTKQEAFRALANGECVEMGGGVYRLIDKLEIWGNNDNSWEPGSIDNCDFVNMRVVPDPSARREITLTTGRRVRIIGKHVLVLDVNGESVCCLTHDEMKEILKAMEESSND